MVIDKNASTVKNLKGKIAEVIVAEMFRNMGYTVYLSGMEHTFPGFGKIDMLPHEGAAAYRVRKSPDFLIVKEGKEPAFIEVKYRHRGKFDHHDFVQAYDKGCPTEESYIVLVSPDSIKIQIASEIKAGKPLVTIGEKIIGVEMDNKVWKDYIEVCKTVFSWDVSAKNATPTDELKV
jgi:Holliday junction resolvase-like predicted endonuclease